MFSPAGSSSRDIFTSASRAELACRLAMPGSPAFNTSSRSRHSSARTSPTTSRGGRIRRLSFTNAKVYESAGIYLGTDSDGWPVVGHLQYVVHGDGTANWPTVRFTAGEASPTGSSPCRGRTEQQALDNVGQFGRRALSSSSRVARRAGPPMTRSPRRVSTKQDGRIHREETAFRRLLIW
jgi:hypothetical protein